MPIAGIQRLRGSALRAASEMAGLRRMVEGMRQGMQALEDELLQAREERAALDMERAAAADEADAASAALAAAQARQADLVAAVDEVLLSGFTALRAEAARQACS